MILMSASQLSDRSHLVHADSTVFFLFELKSLKLLDLRKAGDVLDERVEFFEPGEDVVEALDHEHEVD